MEKTYQAPPIPNAFIWRRAHSLAGLWLVLFLVEHLLTNSQAALWIGDDGSGFVRMVNSLKELPYLQAIEIIFLGIPFLIHGIWGIQYLMASKINSFATDGSSPSLPYARNKAYTWQRITSWILLFGILAHVIQMRFMEYPTSASVNGKPSYMIRIDHDEGLQTLAKRLGFTIYTIPQIKVEKVRLLLQSSSEKQNDPAALQTAHEEKEWVEALEKWKLNENQAVAVASSFGTAELLMVRNTFKSPFMIFCYTVLVLAACYHAFNGLWSFMIAWGIALTARSQQIFRSLSTGLMILISFLGLAAIWGTYWINLRH
jgi:succinate dehydrogenase / fumarate reductase cytochrome b subunit